MTVVIITVRLNPMASEAHEFADSYADLIRETGKDTGEVREVTYEVRIGPSAQWCPVCKTYHDKVGEQTDAGLITRACPRVATDDPRYYGSPVYTGDR